MPSLDTDLHLSMLAESRGRRSLRARLGNALRCLRGGTDIYGLEWGDPDALAPLTYIRDRFLAPYVDSCATAVEIGPGGGRWTRYMMGAKALYALDCHQELLEELERNFKGPSLHPVLNDGDDFPGIPDACVDFVFSFGTFVHLDLDIIERYLVNMKRILAPGASVVIQYSDKTKPLGKLNPEFSENDPETMLALLTASGYETLEQDTGTLWHSSLVRFRRTGIDRRGQDGLGTGSKTSGGFVLPSTTVATRGSSR